MLLDPDKFVAVVTVEPCGLGNPMVFRLSDWKAICEELQTLLFENGDTVVVKHIRMTEGELLVMTEHQGW